MQLGFIAHNDVHALEEDCRFAATHDFSALEFNFAHTVSHIPAKTIRTMRQILDTYGISCASCGLWGVNHISPDTQIRQHASVERACAIEYAAMLGAKVVVLGSGEVSQVLDENVYTFAHVMRSSIDALASQHMALALYGFHDGFLTTPTAIERLWSVVGDVGFKLDAANILHAGFDYIDFVRRHGKRVRHMHIKDTLIHNGTRIAEPPAGMGDIAWGKLIGLLYEAEYRGVLSIEPHGAFWSRPGHREQSLLLAKRWLSQYVVRSLS